MTGEPTVPVPIPDLLARLGPAIDRMAEAAILDEIEPGDRDLIVRGVRGLAARVETLTEYVEANETLSGARRRTSNAEWRAALDDFQAARRALLEEAK